MNSGRIKNIHGWNRLLAEDVLFEKEMKLEDP
jgi:hypothetical protein